jgi:hypothetical protein
MGTRTVGEVNINVVANTSKVVTGFEAARKASRESAKQMKADMLEARGGVMVLGEEIGVHLPRHVQAFVAKLPGVAAAMSAAFAPLAVIAIAAAIFEAGKKAFEYGEKMKDAAKKHAEAARSLTDSLAKANLQQQVENDKLDEKIAKLEHKPGNALQTALDEARLSAFNLAEQLQKTIDKERELLDASNANILQRLFGAASNESVKRGLDAYQQRLHDEDERHRNELASNGWSVEDSLRGRKLSPQDEQIEHERRNARITEDYYNQLTSEIGRRQRYQELRGNFRKTGMTDEFFQLESEFRKTGSAGNQNVIIPALQQLQANIGTLGWGQFGIADHDAKSQQEARLQTDANAAEEARRVARKRLEDFETAFRQQKTMHGMSNQEEVNFWQSKLDVFKVGTSEYLSVLDKYSAALQERYHAEDVSDKATEESITRAFHLRAEAQKEQMRQAEVNLGRGEASKLTPSIGAENAAEVDSMMAREAERTGQMRKGTAAIIEQRAAVAKLARELQGAKDKQDQIAKEGAAHWTAEGNPETAANAVLAVQGKLTVAQLQLGFLQQQQTIQAKLGETFSIWIQGATDVGAATHRMFDQTMSSFNDAVMKKLTERDSRGAWKDMGKQIFSGVTRSTLEMGEGSLMKAVGLDKLGLTHGKLGSKGNPMWIKSADAAQRSLFGSGSGDGGESSSSLGGAGGFLGSMFSIAKFAGFMADGGLMNPGGFYLTGERGPELLQVGATSRISNARDTARAFSGNSEVHHHHEYHIDARGASDAAAVRVQIMRGIQEAAPHLIAAGVQAHYDVAARKPGMRS